MRLHEPVRRAGILLLLRRCLLLVVRTVAIGSSWVPSIGTVGLLGWLVAVGSLRRWVVGRGRVVRWLLLMLVIALVSIIEEINGWTPRDH